MKGRTSESEEGGKSAKGGNTSKGKGVNAVESRSSPLRRGSDGSAFVKCERCKKDVPAGLINMHDCSLDAQIKKTLERHVPEPERKKLTKKVKDPNAPKKPPSAFILFMDEFRESFKKANPAAKGNGNTEGGKKWKSMTDEEKKPYFDKVAELKAESVKAMESYNAAEAEEEGGEEGEGEHDEGSDEESDKGEAAAGEEGSMTDEEKKPYSDKDAELKAEYEKAMESYNAAEAEEEGGEEREGEHEEGFDEESDKGEAAAGEEEKLTDEE